MLFREFLIVDLKCDTDVDVSVTSAIIVRGVDPRPRRASMANTSAERIGWPYIVDEGV